MSPLEIINRWCDYAEKYDLSEHKIHFWRIRDIIEKTEVTKENGIFAFLFLLKCKETEERKILIEAVRDWLVFKGYGNDAT